MTPTEYPEPAPLTPTAKWILFIMMVVGVVSAGIAFAYKIAEFLFTLTSEEVQGFADVPVVVYFAVAAGWMALLGWSFLTGKLRDVEDAKSDFLRKEEEMSASVSERDRLPNDRDDLAVLTESADDSHGTRMTYESGTKVPLYVVAVWTALMTAYVIYHVVYLVPDLQAWFKAMH